MTASLLQMKMVPLHSLGVDSYVNLVLLESGLVSPNVSLVMNFTLRITYR